MRASVWGPCPHGRFGGPYRWGTLDGMTELMLIVPHPDDEVFGLGGTFARLAEQGASTAVLTLTRGRAGRTLGLCPPAELGELRERELRTSAAALGVDDLTVWDEHDYVPDDSRGIPRDAGLQDRPAEALERAIALELDRLRPEALVTFGPHGSNGHPDHVATHLRVHGALQRGGHVPARIYHYASEAPYDGAARPGFLSPEEIRDRHQPPSHRIELAPAEVERKLRAMAAHRTQALSVLNFMERFTARLFTETFTRVGVGGAPVAPGAETRTVSFP